MSKVYFFTNTKICMSYVESMGLIVDGIGKKVLAFSWVICYNDEK